MHQTGSTLCSIHQAGSPCTLWHASSCIKALHAACIKLICLVALRRLINVACGIDQTGLPLWIKQSSSWLSGAFVKLASVALYQADSKLGELWGESEQGWIVSKKLIKSKNRNKQSCKCHWVHNYYLAAIMIDCSLVIIPCISHDTTYFCNNSGIFFNYCEAFDSVPHHPLLKRTLIQPPAVVDYLPTYMQIPVGWWGII